MKAMQFIYTAITKIHGIWEVAISDNRLDQIIISALILYDWVLWWKKLDNIQQIKTVFFNMNTCLKALSTSTKERLQKNGNLKWHLAVAAA